MADNVYWNAEVVEDECRPGPSGISNRPPTQATPNVYTAPPQAVTSPGQAGVPHSVVYVTQPPVAKPKRRSLVAWSMEAVPVLPLWVAVIICVINALIPGHGTGIAAFLVLCVGQPNDNRSIWFCKLIAIGIMQSYSVIICCLGLYWSVLWGMKLLSKASKPGYLDREENIAPSAARLPQKVDLFTPLPGSQVVQTTAPSMYQEFYACIPILPLWCAVILCVCNCIVPGFGTLVASFSIFYCGKTNHPTAGKLQTFLMLFISAWLQFITFFTVGYIWSVVWGYAFVTKSVLFAEGQQVIITTTISQTRDVASEQDNVV